MKNTKLLASMMACLALAACGGGGGGGDSESPAPAPAPAPATNEVPPSATASTQAYVQYTGSLAASETAEPLDVSKVTPPTSDTEEPQPVG